MSDKLLYDTTLVLLQKHLWCFKGTKFMEMFYTYFIMAIYSQFYSKMKGAGYKILIFLLLDCIFFIFF